MNASRGFIMTAISFLILLPTILFPALVFCIDEVYGNVSGVRYESCYDEDTCRFDVPGWPDVVGEDILVRLAGVDTPEIRGECDKEKQLARQAHDAVRTLLDEADTITLQNIRRGKHFRLLARIRADGVDLGEWLIEQGLARHDESGERKGWCGEEVVVPPPEEPAGPKVKITGINKDEEIMTLRNEGDKPVNLTGWVLLSERGDQRFTIPQDTLLKPDETLKITSGRSAEHDPPGVIKWTGAYVWNNDESDPGILLNEQGEEVSRWPIN